LDLKRVGIEHAFLPEKKTHAKIKDKSNLVEQLYFITTYKHLQYKISL
jgi:hypothetical protein